MNDLETLKQWTAVVADTGDLSQVAVYRPQDATTNPSLVLKAAQKPESAPLVKDICTRFANSPVDELVDRLLVRLGCEILSLIPGRVSTEVDSRLSFDQAATIARAKRIVEMYSSEGINTSRVLIKIAATWEGIQAAQVLEREGIHTNLTLLFNFVQAVSCAHARVKLISPFVGRIYDWHKKAAGTSWDETANSGLNDPGVMSVASIYRFFKAHDVRTEVMGASFRNLAQIKALAGCDLLTISPDLLQQLSASDSAQADKSHTATTSSAFVRVLGPDASFVSSLTGASLLNSEPRLLGVRPTPEQALALGLSESDFRLSLNEDAMASEKLAEGIRAFCADTLKLEALLQA